ncbi:NAD(P)-dependent oxidoreductase [Alkalicoccus chagannorensis]|uniref:NAD(P)-dependent oxidoreductase n=1 Tax=Alkalicoccus chagannorensis TaxID=427072 RepID=UPI00040FC0B7|nr:NAD(P)H-binding protein [Alkalicoccus chagannorensis]
MKFAIFGSTGRVGKDILTRAVQDGHTCTVLVRSPKRLPSELQEHPNVQIIEGDAKDAGIVRRMFEQDTFDAVVSALSTDKSDTLTAAVPLIISGMKDQGVSRIVTIGTAGILDARDEPDVYRFQSKESRRTTTRAAEEHAAAYESLRDAGLDFTVICPTYLPDGPADENVAWDIQVLPEDGSQVTTGNTGWFAYTHLWNEDFYRKRIGIVEPGTARSH